MMAFWILRVVIALAIEFSEEASKGTVIRVLPLLSGRREREKSRCCWRDRGLLLSRCGCRTRDI